MLFGAVVVIQAELQTLGIAPLTAVGLRYLVSAAVCFSLLLASRRPLLPVRGERLRAFALGAVVYALQSLLFYLALGHGTAGAVSILFYTYPVLVLAITLQQTRTAPGRTAVLAATLSVAGATLLVATDRLVTLDVEGVLLALASSACAAGFLVAQSRMLPRSAHMPAAAMVSTGVAASTLMAAPVLDDQQIISSTAAWLLIISGIATALATAAMYVALQRLGAPRTSAILTAQTAVAVAGSWWVLHEPVLAGQLVGGVAIIGAVVLAARNDGAGPRRRDLPENLRS